MRVTAYKLNAKSIINDNLGKCLLSSLILIFPKFVFAVCVIIALLSYKAAFINLLFAVLGVVLSFGILFVLNSLCVPVGELILFYLANDEAVDELSEDYETIVDTALDMAMEFAFDLPVSDETKEFRFPLKFAEEKSEYKTFTEKDFAAMDFAEEVAMGEEKVHPEAAETLLVEVLGAVRRFGFAHLLKLRMSLLLNLIRDIAQTAFPAVALVAWLLAYALYAPLPIGAFGTLFIGSFAILLLAAMELGLEYDKYRYVYLSLPEFSKDFYDYSFPYKSMLEKSSKRASSGIGAIRKCEISFWGWTVLSFLFLPFVAPVLYFIPYKKLTLYNVII